MNILGLISQLIGIKTLRLTIYIYNIKAEDITIFLSHDIYGNVFCVTHNISIGTCGFIKSCVNNLFAQIKIFSTCQY